jgi:gliding motility-associated-like protein
VPGPPLTTTVIKTNVLCNGDATGTITVNQPPLGTPPFQYSLDGVTWQSSNIFSGLVANSYTVFYRSANGCMGSQSITITEPAKLVAVSTLTAVKCHGESNGIINIIPSGGVSPYRYSIDGGLSWQNNNIFNVPAGNYTITIKDINDCMIVKNSTVTEPALLTASSLNSNASCDGGNDGQINISAIGGNSGYLYSIDGINFQPSNKFYVAPGNYIITVKDNLGCTTSFAASVGLTVNLFLTATPDITICEGTSAQLQLITNANNFAWTPATGLNNTGISNPVADPLVTTKYIVNVVLGRCSASDSMTVNVNPAPIPDAGPDGDICYGESDTLKGSGGMQFQWSPAIYLNTTAGASPIATPNITTTYRLSVIDALGCRSLVSDEVKVIVTKPLRVYTFPFDTIAYPGDRFQLQAISEGILYSWSPSGGLSNSNIPNPVVTAGSIGDDITYRVIAASARGCKGEGYVRIKVSKGPDIYVPNGFTPNADGKNERFTPIPIGIKSYNYFRVFNRWGQIIFSTKKQYEGWDGNLGGKEQPAGVYVWMIEAVTKDNRVISKKGTVTLIR